MANPSVKNNSGRGGDEPQLPKLCSFLIGRHKKSIQMLENDGRKISREKGIKNLLI